MTEAPRRHDSTAEELAAAARLARSRTVQAAVRVLLGYVLLPLATAVGGWIAAKLDTLTEIRSLRIDIVALTRQQAELVGRVDALFREPDGAIPALRLEDRGIRRDLVVVATSALAFETAARKKAKLLAGESRAKAYDRQLQRLVPAAAAYEAVIDRVAAP